MMDDMISMFIDNELGIDDKIEFVERVHSDKTFKEESVELLNQERVIRSEVVDHVPPVKLKVSKGFFSSLFTPLLRPMGLVASAVAGVLIILFFSMPSQVHTAVPYRFVFYRPDVIRAEITGSFTEWKKIPMKRTGSTGYWEITLNLPEGEHRFTYILEGQERFADPTVPTRERDDFGGQNSIILVES
ncbi:MAG: glycogen-binding domain-containing protein [Deltaproteobacteria bacterium]|nr:MAG: glycogen-binding domain-containing protein [Deltaproteobacteria bacterium]